MATIGKHMDDMTIEELRADAVKLESRLDELRQKNERLDEEIDDLESEVAKLEEQAEESSESFLRDQLDTMAIDCDHTQLTRDQFTRMINGVLRGEDWRHGTWK